MSTNIDPSIPSAQSLEELANKFFKSLPGNRSVRNAISDISMQGVTNLNTAGAFNIKQPQSSLPDPFFADSHVAPQSKAGDGISPTVFDRTNQVNLENTNTPQFSHFQNDLNGRRSTTGFGISPSAIDQRNAVNLQNPTSSFPDPHVAGNYATPPVSFADVESPFASASILNSLPFVGSSYADIDLLKIMPDSRINNIDIHNLSPANFPVSDSFYFLKENNISGFPNNYNPVNGNKKESSIKGISPNNFDVNFIRKDFPILKERVNGKQLIWFDNAATTQKPRQVIDRISHFYEHENSNVHRAAHELAARSTDAYEGARKKIQVFMNAASPNEIVFVRGATEAINLVAKSWGEQTLNAGDEIIISNLEHHANIVPWKQLADKKGLKIRVIPVDDDGQIILSEFEKLLGPKTKLVAITHVSNALGTITPLKEIIDMAHSTGAKVLVDGAQSVSHMKVDLQYLNPDFFVFSGHKIFAPTGIGVLYGKEALLNDMQPWQGGGNMIQDVTFEKIKYHHAPYRFEAGTGNIADAVGLGAAIDYVSQLGIELLGKYEDFLVSYATRLLKDIPGIRLIGTAAKKASVISFVINGFKTEDVGAALSKEGIAVRSGHHCAQPILRRFGLETSVRPSLAFYNTCGEIDVMVDTLYKLQRGKRFH